MEVMQAASVPMIATIVYWIINLISHALKNKETFLRFAPLLSFCLGAGIGVLCYYAIPSANAADNVLTAFVGGGTSGLSGSGFTAMFKGFKRAKPTPTAVAAPPIAQPVVAVISAEALQQNEKNTAITLPIVNTNEPQQNTEIAAQQIIVLPTENTTAQLE